ncbi:MAG: hypothetical protein MJZ20_04675 [Bacteroidaceae bacterium]|nr:hypothetical protein [Bacteroidaceae bacterium]
MEEAKQYLGEIEPSESREIEPIVERIAGLEELLLIVEDVALSDKIKKEIEELRLKCDEWWKKIIVNHGWVVSPNTHWEVDYVDNEVWIK